MIGTPITIVTMVSVFSTINNLLIKCKNDETYKNLIIGRIV